MFCLFLLLLHLTETHQQECRNPVDVIFALDATVDFYQFEQMKHFLNDSLNEFYVDEKITRVAVLSYATKVVASRNLSSFQTKEAISQFVNGLNIEDDKPNIASAFAAVRNNFSKVSERRDMVPVVVVLLSGGGVDNFDAALVESISLRETHVSIIIATMNNSFPFTGFDALASYPFKRNFYSFNSNDVQSDLIANICNRDIFTCRDYCQGRGECISDSCDCFPGFSGKFCNKIGCFQPVNVYFALTAASSINAETFENQLDLAQSVLLNLNLMESKIGMAVYYNNTVDVKFDFKIYENFSTDGNWFQRRMLDATSSVFRMGYTNLTHVLKVVRQSVFASRGNNVLVLFVSGPSADIFASAREAALARNGPEVIQILVVTVGDLFSRDEVDAIAITPGINMNQGVNILPFNSFRSNLATDLVDSICNTKYECFPNPCLNSGICIDFINGYRCYCPNNRAGLNCEYEGNEFIDLVFGFDTSGSIRNREFEDLLSFAVRLVSKLDVSPSKTRVAGIKWNRIGYDLFHLDTFTSKQDVGWAISQITYEPFEEGTNTTDALRIIKDILLNPGQNGERQSARNIVLLFTDGNSNIDEEQTIPMAIDLKTTRNTRIITFGFGHFVNYNELISTCLIPPKQNEDYFIIPSVDSINDTVDALFQTIISVGSCQNETCRNGGFCELRRRPTCICSGQFGGKYCEKYCSQSIDLVFLLDTSGSEAYTIMNSIVLARQIASFFPLESTKFSVVTFGSIVRINFSLRNFNNFQDLMDTFAFRVSTSSNFIRNAIKFLGEGLTAEGPQIFSTTNGGRRSSADVVVIISGSYSTFEYEEVIKEAQIIRDTGTRIYSVLTDNSPNKDLYLSIVGNSSRFFTLNSTEELDRVAERIATSICSDNNI